VVSSHGRFVWYELVTTDVPAAMAFYTKIMGWGAWDVSVPGKACILFSDGKASVGGLTQLSDDARETGTAPTWIGYVGVDDVDATADRITRLGGTVHVPPTDASDISRFSIFADPQTTRLALFKWLKPGQGQFPDPDARGHVGWHELSAADWETALAFYGELFGWQREDADIGDTDEYQLFSAGGQTIGGLVTKPPTIPAPFWLYYFNVGDIDAAAQRVKAGGGQILDGPTEVPGGSWIVRCVDPQGALFALKGTRRSPAVGYFERAASRDSSSTRGRRWSW
jgi:uncharacterized protein